MLKARNLLLIFVLNYLLILLACSVAEITLIGQKAQHVQLLIQTAADMALEQVQATDDYFVMGGMYKLNEAGYFEANNNAYTSKCVDELTGTYTDKFFYSAVTGETDIDNIFAKLYGQSKMKDFIDRVPAINNIRFLAGNVEVTGSLSGVGYYSPVSYFSTKWYTVPMLAQIGNMRNILGTQQMVHKIGGGTASGDAITKIWNNYDLYGTAENSKYSGMGFTSLYAKRHTDASGTNAMDYYLTPLSLGVTYLDEELLQAFFMNNLDLLMRVKYAQDPNYNLNEEKYGAGVLKGSSYANYIDEISDELNPINDGYVTLIKGERHGSGSLGYWYEGIMPKIEYVVIDKYDDSNNEILRRLFGAKFTETTATNNKYHGKPVTGSDFKEMNQENIRAIKSLVTGGTNENIDLFMDESPIVVAKVTFYADFIIPYETFGLREMRVREENGQVGISARTLFNPFYYTNFNDSIEPLSGNYGDLHNKTQSDRAMEIYQDKTTLLDNIKEWHSAMTYTTYFAVTP